MDCGKRYLSITQHIKDEDLKKMVAVYHTKIPKTIKDDIAESLLDPQGIVRLIIATSALSMGFDAKGIQYVIHTDMPKTLADLIQMTECAGRSTGIKASSLLFSKGKPRNIELSADHYRKQSAVCRIKVLGQYFEGDVDTHDNNSNCCDVCEQLSEDNELIHMVEHSSSQKTQLE